MEMMRAKMRISLMLEGSILILEPTSEEAIAER